MKRAPFTYIAPASTLAICCAMAAQPGINLTADFANQVEARMNAEVNAFNAGDQKVDAHMQEIRKRELATRQQLSMFTSESPEQLRSAFSEWSEMLHLTHNMKAEMLALYSNESGAVETVMDERLAAAHQTADNVMQVIGAVEEANITDDRRAAWRGTSNTARQNDRAHVSAANRSVTTAGDYSFADVYMLAGYTSFDDDVAQADGHETEFTISTTFDFTDALYLGVSYTSATFDIGGITNLERQTDTIDLSLQYDVNEWLAVAGFIGYSHIDIEDTTYIDPLLGPISLGDTFDRWNGGFAASMNREISGFDFGITPALSALDADEADRMFDLNQLMLLCMFDVQRAWTDNWSSIAYASYFHATGNDLSGDDKYWLIGAECTWAFNDRIAIALGYEKTVGYDDYEDNRFLGSFTWTF